MTVKLAVNFGGTFDDGVQDSCRCGGFGVCGVLGRFGGNQHPSSGRCLLGHAGGRSQCVAASINCAPQRSSSVFVGFGDPCTRSVL